MVIIVFIDIQFSCKYEDSNAVANFMNFHVANDHLEYPSILQS